MDNIWNKEEAFGVTIPNYRKDHVWGADVEPIVWPTWALSERDVALLGRIATKRKREGAWKAFCTARTALWSTHQ